VTIMTGIINNPYFPIEHPPIASVMAVGSVLCKIRRNPYLQRAVRLSLKY